MTSVAPFFDSQDFHSQARPALSIYRVFTESSQSPFFHLIYRVFTELSQALFFDLQGFYRVKPGPLVGFTGFLQSQARPPFSIYRVFKESNQAPFSMYRVFTESSQAHVLDLQGFYRVKLGPLF